MCRIGVQIYKDENHLKIGLNMRISTSADLALVQSGTNSHVDAYAVTKLGEHNVLKLFPEGIVFEPREGILEGEGKVIQVARIPLGGKYMTIKDLEQALKLA